MASLIRHDAAAEDILKDVAQTLAKAHARGGTWKSAADEKLGPLVALAEKIAERLAKARKDLVPLENAIEAEDELADPLIGHVSDEIWNAVGRPASDPILSVIFPGGIAYYTAGADDEQPDRMELLAELLEMGLHPKLDDKVARKHAADVRKEGTKYGALVEKARVPRARVKLLEKMQIALAHAAHVELTNLKRRYKSDGHSDADIHAVIPGYSRASSKKQSASAPPVTPGTTPTNGGSGSTPT